MEVKIDKRYPLDVGPARAWEVLRDVKVVAGCMPGRSHHRTGRRHALQGQREGEGRPGEFRICR